jgi:hypothetical protein
MLLLQVKITQTWKLEQPIYNLLGQGQACWAQTGRQS